MCIRGIPVPIYQDPFELNSLRDLLRAHRAAKIDQPFRILEIGSLFGGTLWAWLHDASPNALVVSVDTGVQSFDYRHEDIAAARRFWPTWAETTGNTLHQIRTDSTKDRTINQVRQFAPFDFVFIDGGHDERTASADLANYWPMLAEDGFLAFHDIAYPEDHGFATARVWKRFRQTVPAYTEFIRPSNPEKIWGIGVAFRSPRR